MITSLFAHQNTVAEAICGTIAANKIVANEAVFNDDTSHRCLLPGDSIDRLSPSGRLFWQRFGVLA
jgi:hypothetical protein